MNSIQTAENSFSISQVMKFYFHQRVMFSSGGGGGGERRMFKSGLA